jgi:hypothetical protein
MTALGWKAGQPHEGANGWRHHDRPLVMGVVLTVARQVTSMAWVFFWWLVSWQKGTHQINKGGNADQITSEVPEHGQAHQPADGSQRSGRLGDHHHQVTSHKMPKATCRGVCADQRKRQTETRCAGERTARGSGA